jgi:alkanesulfonate monooxygenase SsuD/methylene tetrahydromethanopterin reductase-like flavin-dependent oxidoreductase (luciferase family)
VRLGVVLWPQTDSWPALRDAAVRAEAAGLDSIWTWDHLHANVGTDETPVLEGWTLVAALALVTSRVTVGPLVASNAARNPGVTVKAAITVDHLSGGRLVLGLGSGPNERDQVGFGLDPRARPGDPIGLRRLEEAVPLIRRLLDGETVSHAGEYYGMDAARARPRPLQPRVPILIGGSGRKRTLPLVARWADAWNAAGPIDEVRAAGERLNALCLQLGRDPGSLERTLVKGIVVRDDAVAARAWFDASLRANGETDVTRYAPLVGSPRAIADGLRPFIELGFDHVIVSMPAPYDPETIERLGEVGLAVTR